MIKEFGYVASNSLPGYQYFRSNCRIIYTRWSRNNLDGYNAFFKNYSTIKFN